MNTLTSSIKFQHDEEELKIKRYFIKFLEEFRHSDERDGEPKYIALAKQMRNNKSNTITINIIDIMHEDNIFYEAIVNDFYRF